MSGNQIPRYRKIQERLKELFDANENAGEKQLTPQAIYLKVGKEFSHSSKSIRSIRYYDLDKLEKETKKTA